MQKHLESLVTKAGYTKYEPEIFEYFEPFVRNNKRLKKDSLVQIIAQSGDVLLLRPDATSSIMREIMPLCQESDMMKIYYDTSTFSKTNQGMIEEKRQFGIEVLGQQEGFIEGEVLNLALKTFQTFDLNPIIEVNNNQFILALFEALELTDQQINTLKKLIYYKNQHGIEEFVKTYLDQSIFKSVVKKILALEGDLAMINDQLVECAITKTMKESLDNLAVLSAYLEKNDLLKYIRFDLSLMTTYDYYEGLVFQGYLENTPQAILSGGAYQPLTKSYGKTLEAIGFTLNTTDLLKEMITNG